MGKQRTYTEAEKLPIMIAAVETTALEAAGRFDVPAPTIYSWVQEAGGLMKIREALNERASASLLTTRAAVMAELHERVGQLDNHQLLEAVRAMLPREQADAAVAAQATAQAGVIVVQLKDGEVLELPDPDADAQSGHL